MLAVDVSWLRRDETKRTQHHLIWELHVTVTLKFPVAKMFFQYTCRLRVSMSLIRLIKIKCGLKNKYVYCKFQESLSLAITFLLQN